MEEELLTKALVIFDLSERPDSDETAYFYENISEEELRQEVEDLKQWYDIVRVGKLPPHIRREKILC